MHDHNTIGGGNTDMEVEDSTSEAADAATWRLPWWLSPWACRGFSFPAALDPLIAVAALHPAAATHRLRLERRGMSLLPALRHGRGLHAGPLAGLRVYDPCCGSGRSSPPQPPSAPPQ